MFSQFILLEGGSLFIRSADLRTLKDVDDHAYIEWASNDTHANGAHVTGTAEENLNRLKQEETDALIAAEKLRQRQSSGYPPEPIQRGMQSLKVRK